MSKSGLIAKLKVIFNDLSGASANSKATDMGTDIYDEVAGDNITSGDGAPTSTPNAIGDRYIDTTGNREYYAIDINSSADWKKVSVMYSDTETLTAGGGDLTVNLPWSWEGGILFAIYTDTSTEYFSDNNSIASLIITTYDALTGSYLTDHELAFNVSPDIASYDKSVNGAGIIKSAISDGFVFDDDGVGTLYIKWVVIA